MRTCLQLLAPLLLCTAGGCGYAGPLDDYGTPGNGRDGSGTWLSSGDDEDDDDDEDTDHESAEPVPEGIAISPDEAYVYALYGVGVAAVDLETGESRLVAADEDVSAWGVFFGDAETLVVGIRESDGTDTTVWRVEGAEPQGSADFDLDLRGARVSPTGDYLSVAGDAGIDIIATDDLSWRVLETESEPESESLRLHLGSAWVPGTDTLLRTVFETEDLSTGTMKLEAWDLGPAAGGSVAIFADVAYAGSWSDLSVNPNGTTVALPFPDGASTAVVDLSSGAITPIEDLGGPLEYLPDGMAILGWDASHDDLVAAWPDGTSTGFSMPEIPIWIVLDDSTTVVASVQYDADETELQVLNVVDGSRTSVPDAFDLREVAVRGTDVFLVASGEEAANAGLYWLDTRSGALVWTGFDASMVSYLPSRDALLIDDPGDRGIYRLIDADTLSVTEWLDL